MEVIERFGKDAVGVCVLGSRLKFSQLTIFDGTLMHLAFNINILFYYYIAGNMLFDASGVLGPRLSLSASKRPHPSITVLILLWNSPD